MENQTYDYRRNAVTALNGAATALANFAPNIARGPIQEAIERETNSELKKDMQDLLESLT